FYVGGTRFLDRCDLRVHGQRPLLLNSAVSGDNLQVAVELTNADVHAGDTILLPGRTLHIGRRLTLYGRQPSQTLAIESFAAGARPEASWSLPAIVHRRREENQSRYQQTSRISTSHEGLTGWLRRSRGDLHMLLTETADGSIPYAGIPWYVAPFGRDSLITALQMLPFEPHIARGTLRFLARHQGTHDDPFTD